MERDQERKIVEAEADLVFKGKKLDIPNSDKLLYSGLSHREKERLRNFLEQSSAGINEERNAHTVISGLVRSHLEFLRRKNEVARETFKIKKTDNLELDNLLHDVLSEISREETLLLYKDMKDIAEVDFVKVSRIIKLLARRLATLLGRRYRSSVQKKKADFRRTIRRSLQYGGAMFDLRYKEKKRRRPEILLICDVSGSMSSYASFIMHFMYELSGAVSRVESFAFSEELEKLTGIFKRNREFQETTNEILRESRTWGAGTNMARALKTFNEQFSYLLTKKTVVLLLSDTKTLYPEEAYAELKKWKHKVRGIVWLNPLPQESWRKINSVKLFKKVALMVECSTLAQLEGVLRHQLL